MLEIMFKGHGGHGSVVAAKLLAEAAAKSGYQAQSFASYGALRRGGKVESYVRISEKQILLHCKMYAPDYLVLMDESFIDEASALSGLREDGKILINTPKRKGEYPSLRKLEVFTVDAYKIATDKGLVIPGGMPVINTTLLGALVGILKVVPVEHLIDVIKRGTPKPDKNAECAMEGYQKTISSPGGDIDVGHSPDIGAPSGVPAGRFPVHNLEKMARCNRCQICYMVCPSLAITFQGDPLRFFINREACTACGICIQECPRNAILWEGNQNDQGNNG